MEPTRPSANSPGSAMQPSRDQLVIDHLTAEVTKLGLENQKLNLELRRLNQPEHWTAKVKQLLPLVTALVAVVGALFGIWQFFYQQKLADQERRKQQEAADAAWRQQQKDAADAFHRSFQLDTARPLWEKRLSLYLEASEMAAVIATTKDNRARRRAEDRFWVLYYGPLATVEKIADEKDRGKLAIVSAMVKFGDAIDGIDPKDRNSSDLHELSLKLAYAVRDAIKPLIETADQKNTPP